MLECFDNYIGLDNRCTNDTPVSGIYINTLRGISLQSIAYFTIAEQEDYLGFWNEVYDGAVTRLRGDILSKMQKYYKTKILLENTVTGIYDTPHETVSSANNYNGIYIYIYESKNTKLVINDVKVYLETVDSSSNNTVKVFDANSGIQLDSIEYTPAVGENTIRINKSYNVGGQNYRIFIAFDGNIGDSISVANTTYDGAKNYTSSSSGYVPVGTNPIHSNLVLDGDSRGMVINYNVECSLDGFICQNRDLFSTALWYLLGAEIMEESIISTKLNKFTLNNSETREALRDKYMDLYEENLESTLMNLTPGSDSICFPCEKARVYNKMLP